MWRAGGWECHFLGGGGGGMRLPSKWHPSVCDFLLLLNERWRVFANVGLEGIAVIRQSSNFSMI